jgi:hypothetical protein
VPVMPLSASLHPSFKPLWRCTHNRDRYEED